MDDPRCYNRQVFYEPFPKIMRGNYYNLDCEGVPLLDLPNIYFASVKPFNHKADIFYRIDKNTDCFIWNKNVFVTALNIILYMGFRKIYLAGVDFNMDQEITFTQKILFLTNIKNGIKIYIITYIDTLTGLLPREECVVYQ